MEMIFEYFLQPERKSDTELIFEHLITLTFFVVLCVLLFGLPVAIIYCTLKVLHFLISVFISAIRGVTEKYLRTAYMTITEYISRKYGGPKGYTIVWKVENLDYCCLRKGQHVTMPVFTTDGLHGTKWSLRLFPKGIGEDCFAAAVLTREYDRYGPDAIKVIYQIVFLDKYRSIVGDKYAWKERDFRRHDFVYFLICERPEKTLGSKRREFLPDGNVMMQCKIFMKNEKPATLDLLSARTKGVRRSFVWKIDKFSTFNTTKTSEFEFIDELGFMISLFLNISSERLHIDIVSFLTSYRFIHL